MQDDMTSLHTTPYIHMHSLTHIIPCSASDRHDTAGVSDLHREGRSLTSAGSIHALLCVRAEDDILVQAVAKYTTSDVFLTVGDRLHQICPDAYRNSAKSDLLDWTTLNF